jgi:outer membrane protein OmpA-like peptidoglycan-associated protein
MSNPGDRWRRGWIPFLILGLLLGGGFLAWFASDNDAKSAAPSTAAQRTPLFVSSTRDEVVLRGQVATDAARTSLLENAQTVFADRKIVDELQVATGAQAVADSLGLFAGLASAEGWTIDVDSGIVRLSGIIVSEDDRTPIRDAAVAAFGPGVEIDDRLIVRPILSNPATTVAATVPPTVPATLPPTTVAATTIAPTTIAATTIAATTVAATTIAATTIVEATAETAVETINEVIDLQPITFQTGSAQLTAEGRTTLDTVAETLAANPSVNVEIQGHTDNFGVPAENQALSQSRAETVRTYLVDKGIDASRLTAVGFGDTQPVADNTTSAGRAQNRRIEFKVAA